MRDNSHSRNYNAPPRKIRPGQEFWDICFECKTCGKYVLGPAWCPQKFWTPAQKKCPECGATGPPGAPMMWFRRLPPLPSVHLGNSDLFKVSGGGRP